MKKRAVVWMLSVVAACLCMSCSSGSLDLNEIDMNAPGDMSFGDADIQFQVDLPGETAAPECETNQDCEAILTDLNVCEIALCDSVLQVCVKGSRKDYSPCDDGDACTYETFCLEGTCAGGQGFECSDGNICTDDSCDPATGCKFTDNEIACNDGNECTSGDVCSAGLCFGQPGECPCESNLDCQMMGDDLCSYAEMDCVDGFCAVTGSVEVVCDSVDSDCMENQCDPMTGECMLSELIGACSDGSTCTVGDACQAGECVPGPNMCDCGSDMDCAGFEDGNLCNGTLACIENACAVDPATVVICSADGLGQCETSLCNAATGVCEVTGKMDGVACDDGDPCTDADVCVSGQCFGGENVCGGCGDDSCDEGESCQTCPDDCGECGDCCVIQDGPGCADDAVEACTCALDPFCCETQWDDVCIDQAVAECALMCGVEPECGDDLCGDAESCETCPADCGECPECGDDFCDAAENCETCPGDCGDCPIGCCEPSDAPGCTDPAIQVCVCELDAFCCESVWDDICVAEVEEYGCGDCGGVGDCGDNICVEPEACFNCPEDCGECSVCGDDTCDPLESCDFCPEDCGECGFCGDDGCGDDEDCKSCPDDCGDCCGNDSCEALFGEDCDTCPADCGECPDECGNDLCDDGENCSNCAADCGDCEGSCCIANGTPGCMDPLVQDCVCAVDIFCCNDIWDELCAAEADECGSCNGQCCETHPTPGCMDSDIEACVCEADPFCCEVAWDGLCVAEVTDLECGICEIVAECGDDVCHGEEDCKSCPADCGECCGNGACEALFEEDCTTCPADCGECPVGCGDDVCGDDETCANCLADCGSCEGSCCLPNGTEGCAREDVQGCVCAMDPYCCNVQWDGLCAAEADECGSCDGDCCDTNGNAGCEEESIEACVCAADPYCCNVNWDNLCVNEVESLDCGICVPADVCGDGICGDTETCETCPNDCGECAGSCCEANEDPGCNDLDCVDFICSIDPYCCENSWDDICVDEALQYCPVCAGTLPFCGDDQCILGETCQTCPQDCGECPFCGDDVCGDDEDCATCPEDCGSCSSDCCESHDGVECDDADCTATVCEMDPYCCNNSWDGICAQEAGAVCLVCGGVEPSCGDGVCGAGESCANCPADCGVCPPECGDAECNGSETCDSCPDDCGECCGNDICDADFDENCASCEADCGLCEDDCCVSNGSPECGNAQCTAVICDADAFCCETAWDQLCANQAADLCPTCGGALPGGNCCAAQESGDNGCEVADCEDIVCEMDGYCCTNTWDLQCADEAAEFCISCGGSGVAPAVCGDNECNGEEDCDTCEADCGACCGDDVCDDAVGENCDTCEADCGACSLPTCLGRCEDAFDAGQPCQCDSLCFDANDCCGDICQECEDSYDADCAAIDDTCQFRCGDFDPDKSCQCDSACFAAADCCGDVCDECTADYPQECI
jgi:hypothetical protein